MRRKERSEKMCAKVEGKTLICVVLKVQELSEKVGCVLQEGFSVRAEISSSMKKKSGNAGL